VYSVPWTCSLLAGGSGSFGAESDEAASGEAAMMALPEDGAAGLIAGGVTFAVCEVAGSSGRTGSLESFAFAGGGSVGSAAFVAELPAEFELLVEAELLDEVAAGAGIGFFSGAFAGLLAFAEGVEAGVAEPGVVGMMEAILSFSTRTKPKSVLILNMLSS